MNDDYPEIVQRTTEVLAVAPDSLQAIRKFWLKHNLQFPGMADPGHTVANLYGQRVELLRLGRLPAVFLIDRAGIISFAHYGSSMADIPEIAELVRLLKQLD